MSYISTIFRTRPTLEHMANHHLISKGTKIDMAEYDLAQFRRGAHSDWEGMVSRWLDSDAKVDIYCQAVHPYAHDVLARMVERYPSLTILDYSTVPEDKVDPVRHGSLDTMKHFHFTLFDNPRQIWLEKYHPFNSDILQDCEWVPEELVVRDPRYYKLADVVRVLKENSRPIEFSQPKIA